MRYISIWVLLISFLFSYSNKDAIKFYKKSDYKKALSIWDKLCAQGNVSACNNEAFLIYNKSLELNINQAKAIKILNDLLKNNPENSSIMYNLALMYWFGYYDKTKEKAIVKREDALKLLKKAIKLKNQSAEIFYNKIRPLIKDINASKKK